MRDSADVDRNSSGQRPESAVDHAIAQLAWRQWGIVTRVQLRALGLSDDEIDYRIAVGRLRLIHRGVYAVGHTGYSPRASGWPRSMPAGRTRFSVTDPRRGCGTCFRTKAGSR